MATSSSEIHDAVEQIEPPQYDDVQPNTSLSWITPSKSNVDVFPSLSSLPPPDVLAERPPYLLHVTQRNDGIKIEGTHVPSLELIRNYFRKGTRLAPGKDGRSMFNFWLYDSSYGPPRAGALDIAAIGVEYAGRVHVTPILLFIEEVLHYELKWQDAHNWRYRRDRAYVM